VSPLLLFVFETFPSVLSKVTFPSMFSQSMSFETITVFDRLIVTHYGAPCEHVATNYDLFESVRT
jgi:hypothetical protein